MHTAFGHAQAQTVEEEDQATLLLQQWLLESAATIISIFTGEET